MTESTGDDWLRAPALAKELTLRTVYKLLDSGEMTSYNIGHVILITGADVDAFRIKVKAR